VLVGDDHQVAAVVGKGVKDHEAGGVALQDAGGLLGLVAGHAVGDGVVGGGDDVAEDAVQVARPRGEGLRDASLAAGAVGSGDVGVAPRGPKAVHRSEYRALTVQRKNRNLYGCRSVQRTGSIQV
jgi:hypothetical protein